MNLKFSLFCVLLACALFLPQPAQSSELIRDQLAERLQQAEADSLISVIIVMQDRPDLTILEAAATGKSKQERRRVVLNILKEHARNSQRDLKLELRSALPADLFDQMKFLWINNTVAGWLPASLIRSLAERNDIESIGLNIPREAFIGTRVTTPAALRKPTPSAGRALVWSLPWIGADTAWSTYNVDGNGVTIAVVDTGADYYHSDLTKNIWINPGENLDGDTEVWDSDDMNGKDDDNNGYVDDLVGYDFGLGDNNPMDDYGHGTHCSGSAAGDGTGGTQTGVAPGANIMVCKVGYWVTTSDEATCWEGMEYAADMGADVLTMSMGWLQEWDPRRVTWRQTCQYVKAAGTVLCIAAGNERSYTWITAPDNLRTPGDCPEVIAVGATGYKNNTYAYFSSYGPSEWYESPFFDYPYPPGLVKPDVCAPGENINSTTWGGGYSGDSWSGTSMATPHVAGVCALMLEANPSLTPDDVQQLMEISATDLGATGKDNDYGSGLVWCPDAVYEALNFGPALTVTATPYSTVVPRGGSLDLDININNSDPSPVSVDGWLDLDIYGSPWLYNPLKGPKVITIPGNGNLNQFLSLPVSYTAPIGNIYELFVRVGTHPGTVKGEDSFTFEVTP